MTNIAQMNKKQRVLWFKVKLLCRKMTLKEMANEVGVNNKHLLKLIKGEDTDSIFNDWVCKNLGRPYWLY